MRRLGKDAYRRQLVEAASARLVTGYVYASAGDGESTQDLVFGGHNLIAENGVLLSEAKRFENQTIYADLDIHRLRHERRRMNTFPAPEKEGYLTLPVHMKKEELSLRRFFPTQPFVPSDEGNEEPPLRGNPFHPVPWPEKEAGAYRKPLCGDWNFGRPGFHACPFW